MQDFTDESDGKDAKYEFGNLWIYLDWMVVTVPSLNSNVISGDVVMIQNK